MFFVEAAGGFFDCLDLDGDGVLELADLAAYAAAYGKPTAGIQANLARMLAAFQLPPDHLPKAVFLELVTQYWFDPSPDVPGRWLFDLDFGLPPSPDPRLVYGQPSKGKQGVVIKVFRLAQSP